MIASQRVVADDAELLPGSLGRDEEGQLARPGARSSGTTVVVIVACFLFGFYLFVVDSGLSWLVDKIFRAAGVVGA